ncbi:MAG TPA: ABC transporter permease [Caulobacteraceae bacterium]|nr:ABC transporter permease [Caulobacteraceae bacterium]
MSAPAASFPWFLRVLVAFVRRELAAVGAYRMAFAIRVLGFGLAVGSLMFLSRFVGAAVNPHLAAYHGNYLGFVVIGFLGTEFQQVGVSVLAQRIRVAQMMGTLEAEVATPAPPWMVLGSPPVYEFVVAALRSAAYLLGAKLLLGLDLSHANWPALAISAPLIIAAFSGLGLLAAATTMLVRRLNPVAMVIGSLSFFLSGVMYPVTVLPGWLRLVGRLLPLTHALALLRGTLLIGSGLAELRSSLLALLAFAGLLAPVGAGMFAFALRRARVDGSLSHY